MFLDCKSIEYMPISFIDKGSTHFFELNPYLLYRTEETRTNPRQWIEDGLRDFQIFNEVALNKGPSGNYHWIVFPIQNDMMSNQTIHVTLKNSAINEIRYYYVINNAIVNSGITGDNFHFDSRPYSFCNFTFPWTLKIGEKGYLIFELDKRNENFFSAFDVSTSSGFHKMETNVYLVFGIFAGIILLSIMLNLVLYIGIKDKVHLWYSIYAFSNLVLILAYDGIDFQFFYPDWPFLSNISRYVATSTTYILLFKLLEVFVMDDELKSKSWIKYIRSFQTLHFLVIVGTLLIFAFWDDSSWLKILAFRFLSILSLVSMIALIGFSWRSVRRGRQQSILFLIAVLILFLGALEYVLNINGWITYLFLFNSTIPSNLQIFIIIEVVLVFIAIAFRFKKIRDENLDYKYQLLLSESRKKDEAIALILQERKRISSELHDGVGSILFGVRMKVHSVFKRRIGGEDEFISLNQDLDLMSESLKKVVWRLQDHGHFGNLVELIVGKAEDQLKKLNKIFQTEISIDSSIEVSDDFSRDFYFLFSEILSNTLKYSTAEKIVCQIVIDGDMIRFKWEDAGRVNQMENSIGMGLQSIQNRISRWQGVIEPGNNRFDYQINFPISAIVKNKSE